MVPKFTSIEQLKRDNRAGMTVPDGYFEELNMKIIETAKLSPKIGKQRSFRGMIGFAMGFAAMALLAVVGFYIAGGDRAAQEEIIEDDMFLLALYNISEEDIAREMYREDITATKEFADAVAEYLTECGDDIVDITEKLIEL